MRQSYLELYLAVREGACEVGITAAELCVPRGLRHRRSVAASAPPGDRGRHARATLPPPDASAHAFACSDWRRATCGSNCSAVPEHGFDISAADYTLGWTPALAADDCCLVRLPPALPTRAVCADLTACTLAGVRRAVLLQRLRARVAQERPRT